VTTVIQHHVVHNSRASDWNTCGQAAMASVLAHFRAGPYIHGSPADARVIDELLDRFGPDVPFGLGTTVHRITAALAAHGIDTDVVHTGLFGHGLSAALRRVTAHAARGIPVPVCVDDGVLGGMPWSAHWALVLGIDDARVRLGNARVTSLSLDRFLVAWRCRHLPPPHRHCAVLAFR